MGSIPTGPSKNFRGTILVDAVSEGTGFVADQASLAEAVTTRLLLRKALLLLQQRDEHADHLRHLQEEDTPLRAVEHFGLRGR